MKTTTTNNQLSEAMVKQLALMIHNDEPFFIDSEGNVYEGTEEDALNEYNEVDEQERDEQCPTFEIWAACKLSPVEEYDEDGDYLVLTDDEADEMCKERILDSLWAFNSWFLASETGIDEAVFSAIQDNGKCESNNDAILSCIDDEDSFVDAAISADGRGHFLSGYDGKEDEVQVGDFGTFYIYRTN